MAIEPAPRVLPKINNFVASVSGSDKIFRTSLYTLRVLDNYLARNYGEKLELLKRIRNFTGPIGDTRMVLRLFGIFPTIEGVLTNTETDPFLRPLSQIQAWSMILYYPLDNVYWLALHDIIPMSAEMRDRASRISCQAWFVYILLDIVAYLYKFRGLDRLEKEIRSKPVSETASLELASIASQRSDMRLRTIAALADLCLAYHWSVQVSYFPPHGVGLAGTVSSLLGLYLKWKYTS